jgi:hypothetical protein
VIDGHADSVDPFARRCYTDGHVDTDGYAMDQHPDLLVRSLYYCLYRSDGHHGAVGDGCRWPQWHCRRSLPIRKSTPVVLPVIPVLFLFVLRTNGHTDTVGC